MARLIAILLTLALLALSGGGGMAVAQGPVWAQAEALPETGGSGTETSTLPRSPARPPPGRRVARLVPRARRPRPTRRPPGPQARAPPSR